MLQVATPVCRILEHLFSLPQGDTRMHRVRNWSSPFNVHSGPSCLLFYIYHGLNYTLRTRTGEEFLAYIYVRP